MLPEIPFQQEQHYLQQLLELVWGPILMVLLSQPFIPVVAIFPSMAPVLPLVGLMVLSLRKIQKLMRVLAPSTLPVTQPLEHGVG